MNRLALTATILLAPSVAFTQSRYYDEKVYLNKFDQLSNTYSGRIIVTYQLCGDAQYGATFQFDRVTTSLLFDKATNSADARAKKQADVNRIIADVAHDAELCPVK
jgi:hypothetical protein